MIYFLAIIFIYISTLCFLGCVTINSRVWKANKKCITATKLSFLKKETLQVLFQKWWICEPFVMWQIPSLKSNFSLIPFNIVRSKLAVMFVILSGKSCKLRGIWGDTHDLWCNPIKNRMECGLESAVTIEEGDCFRQNLVQSNNEDAHYWEKGKRSSDNGTVPNLFGKWTMNFIFL